jgi:hypothetical protein
MNNYLIPANSKRSMLILGWFKPIDLIIFGVGIGLSVLLMIVFGTGTVKDMLFDLTPAIITSIMVLPIPNHRNIWNLTLNIYNYLVNQRNYKWRGWCILHGEETNEK